MSVGESCVKSNDSVRNGLYLNDLLLVVRIRASCNTNKISYLPANSFWWIDIYRLRSNLNCLLKSCECICNNFSIKLNKPCVDYCSISSLNKQIPCRSWRRRNSIQFNGCQVLLRLCLLPNQKFSFSHINVVSFQRDTLVLSKSQSSINYQYSHTHIFVKNDVPWSLNYNLRSINCRLGGSIVCPCGGLRP